MKIEISEQPTNEPLFPAFYKDFEDDLWFWSNKDLGLCISDDTVHVDDWHDGKDFEELNKCYEFVRVRGTITITV